jgi:hypothetical protein
MSRPFAPYPVAKANGNPAFFQNISNRIARLAVEIDVKDCPIKHSVLGEVDGIRHPGSHSAYSMAKVGQHILDQHRNHPLIFDNKNTKPLQGETLSELFM